MAISHHRYYITYYIIVALISFSIVGSFSVMISRIIYLYIYISQKTRIGSRRNPASAQPRSIWGIFISAALTDCVFNSSQSFFV